MSYTVILDEGLVLRDADGVVVAPCQSVDEPAFQAYLGWIDAGGEPLLCDTRDTRTTLAAEAP